MPDNCWFLISHLCEWKCYVFSRRLTNEKWEFYKFIHEPFKLPFNKPSPIPSCHPPPTTTLFYTQRIYATNQQVTEIIGLVLAAICLSLKRLAKYSRIALERSVRFELQPSLSQWCFPDSFLYFHSLPLFSLGKFKSIGFPSFWTWLEYRALLFILQFPLQNNLCLTPASGKVLD